MSLSLGQRILTAPGPTAPDHPVAAHGLDRITRSEVTGMGPGAAIPPGAVVAVCMADPLALLRVLIGLDGHAGGLLLLSYSLAAEHVAALRTIASVTHVVSDRADIIGAILPQDAVTAGAAAPRAPSSTAWMMTTSGTTGRPKIVPHDLDSLARTVRRDPLALAPVWGLILDPTRFAGMQVALQALTGGGTLVVAPQQDGTADQIAALAAGGVTHLSATPTLWRRLLMAPGLDALALRQVTMGGEIADQAILDAAGRRFPGARVTHIYASTEAGVGFAVNDRLAGFPQAFLDAVPSGVGVRVVDGMLWLKPPGGRRVRYLGDQKIAVDADGYVATGDRVEATGDRFVFLGRDTGVVNVGGVKVYPERVERAIASVPGVGLAQVTAKSNPITGALLMATVVPATADADQGVLRDEILAHCRATLEREAVPARIRFAEALDTNAAGKILRA